MNFKILKDGQEIDWLYGGGEYKITKKEIEALLKGKKLYGTVNDEYAFTIKLEGKK